MGTWWSWLILTVSCWGLYGILLHAGAVGMADPVHGRLKAFLFVGVAYFLFAVLAPAGMLWLRGATWDFTPAAVGWSLVAGTVGAIGAFGVLMAFGAGGRPAVVMSLVFSGAPLVNAFVSVTKDGAWDSVRWPFLLGIALAATGGFLVVRYKPAPAHAPAPAEVPAAPPADEAS